MSNMRVLAIVGYRKFTDYPLFKKRVDTWIAANGEVGRICSGGAPGADALAKRYAAEACLEYLEVPADWKRLGRQAGPLRNSKIVEYSSAVIAFLHPLSVGTQDTIKKATQAGKTVHVVHITSEEKCESVPETRPTPTTDCDNPSVLVAEPVGANRTEKRSRVELEAAGPESSDAP